MISVIDGDEEVFRLEGWPDSWFGLALMEGRLLGRIPEPQPGAVDHAAPDRAIHAPSWPLTRHEAALRIAAELGGVLVMVGADFYVDHGGVTLKKIEFPADSVDHADLLRRYVRLVVQSEGSDLLKRAGTGGVDATFSADELALLARLSEDATR